MNETIRPDDEIDLLDLLVTVAENIKLLILVPLLVGAATFLGASFWPAQYESSFLLDAEKTVLQEGQKLKLIDPQTVSSRVLDPSTLALAAQSLTTAGQSQFAQALSSAAVSSKIVRSAPTQVQVNVRAESPQAAQAMSQAILVTTLLSTQPQGDERKQVEADLRNDRSALQMARTVESRLRQNLEQTGQLDPALTQSYASLLLTIPTLSEMVEEHSLRLNGLTQADVLLQPSLPSAPASPKRNMVTAVAILASGFALLLWVFVRKAFQGAAINPESAAKITRIRQALGLKART